MLDIHNLMTSLALRRALFHSEADFQQELALEIRRAWVDCPIRLEFPPFPDRDKRMAFDIWLPGVDIPIELKYFIRKYDGTVAGERFSLANQAARDHKRYDFLRDIQRIEDIAAYYESAYCGFAVLLTNDPLLWERREPADVVDAEFHIYDGRRIGDSNMHWSNSASDGTKRSREEPISLSRSYVLNWRNYSALGEKRGERFRYLAVSIPPVKEKTP
ncbi:MAG: hypothetical protein F4X64_04430 [Chloroflexi bacterium]|nr:hypothetical protein [Chloroflexota bacterium]